MTKNEYRNLTILLLIILSAPSIIAYPATEERPVHQYISENAINLLINELGPAFNEFEEYKEDILRGAALEDLEETKTSLCILPEEDEKSLINYRFVDHPWCWHFWKTDETDMPDGEEMGLRFDSLIPPNLEKYYKTTKFHNSYQEAEFWYEKAIKAYKDGEKNRAYFFLGRVSHLLEDVSVPAHLHNDIHATNNEWIVSILGPTIGTDSYEEYVGLNYNKILLNNLMIPQKITNLFDIFSSIAEKADDYPSDDVIGESNSGKAGEINKRYKEKWLK